MMATEVGSNCILATICSAVTRGASRFWPDTSLMTISSMACAIRAPVSSVADSSLTRLLGLRKSV